MANVYDIGDDVELKGTFTNAAGTEIDPTAVVCIVKKSDGSFVSYLSATGFSDQGNWDASTNTPALANGTGTAGHRYTVTAAGTVDFGDGEITFAVDDYVFYNGAAWRRIPSPSSTTLTNSAVGVYTVNQHITQHGDSWYYRFESAGSRAADENSLRVNSSAI